MTNTDGLSARLAHFIHHYFIWFVIGSYVVAGFIPGPGLWIRAAAAGEVTIFQDKIKVTLPLVMLAMLMFGLGMNNNGTGLVLASMALADHPRVMLPIIFYDLVQHLMAGTVDWAMYRKRARETDIAKRRIAEPRTAILLARRAATLELGFALPAMRSRSPNERRRYVTRPTNEAFTVAGAEPKRCPSRYRAGASLTLCRQPPRPRCKGLILGRSEYNAKGN